MEEVKNMEIDDMQSDDDCYEEEEMLLYVELDPTSLAEKQLRTAKNLKIFGFDTKEPLLQVSNRFFQGEFDLSMGTHVFLEKNEEKPVDELYCKCENYYGFAAKTNKVLKVSRVLLQDKTPESAVLPEKDLKDVKKQLQVTMTYEKALNKLLTQGRQQPRTIPKDFNAENLLNHLASEASKQEAENLQEKAEEEAENSQKTEKIQERAGNSKETKKNQMEVENDQEKIVVKKNLKNL